MSDLLIELVVDGNRRFLKRELNVSTKKCRHILKVKQ